MAQQIQDYVEARRIARMSHEPSDGPDEMVAKTFLPLNGIKPPTPSPFPMLRPNSEADRQQQAQQFLYHRPASLSTNEPGALGKRKGPNASSPTPTSTSNQSGPSHPSSPVGTAQGGSRPSPAKERIILPPPSSRWYPLKGGVRPTIGDAIDPSVASSVESPKAVARAHHRKTVAEEVQGRFLVKPPPGVGGKKRKSSAGSKGNSSRGSSLIKPPSRPGTSEKGATGGKKKGALVGATAIPSTTDAIAKVVVQQAEAASNGQPYIPNNLKALMAVLKSYMDDDGMLTALGFTKALKDLGVGDVSVADSIFRRLESRGHPNHALYGSVLAAFSEVLNGAHTRELVASACFNLFDLNNRGYIHKSHLEELKFMQVTLNGHPMCTPFMVKVLTDLFNDMQAKEEEYYINVVLRKGKKSSKKKPPQLKSHQNSVIPVERKVSQHMDRTLFMAYFATHRELALAFAPRWIPLIDSNDDVGMAASEAMMHFENPPPPMVEEGNTTFNRMSIVGASSTNTPTALGASDGKDTPGASP